MTFKNLSHTNSTQSPGPTAKQGKRFYKVRVAVAGGIAVLLVLSVAHSLESTPLQETLTASREFVSQKSRTLPFIFAPNSQTHDTTATTTNPQSERAQHEQSSTTDLGAQQPPIQPSPTPPQSSLLPQDLSPKAIPRFVSIILSSLGIGEKRMVVVDEEGKLDTQPLPTDEQQLGLTDRALSITNGNTVTLPSDLQDLELEGNKLKISRGNGVTLPLASGVQSGLLTSEDWLNFSQVQELALDGRDLSIGGGNTVTLPNDLQELSLTDETITLTKGNSITLPLASGIQKGLLTSTDWLAFSQKEEILSFSSGLTRVDNTVSVTSNSLDFAQFADAMTLDADSSINLNNNGTPQDLRFYNSNSGSEMLFLDGSTGSVGIGTTGPNSNSKLQVQGSGDTVLRIRATDNGSPQLRLQNSSNNTFSIYQPATTAGLVFEQFAVGVRMAINSAGNVGIGTTAPASKLDVAGTVNIAAGNTYKINGADVLSATTLGSGVTSSSLTGVGVLDAGSITSGFGDINIGSSTFTGNGSGITSLNADNISSGTLNSARLAGTYIIDILGNAATATALQTARTLWGQSFDGTGNVSGDLSSVGNITGSGALTLAAGGANQNIRLTPSGTGYTILDGNVGIGTTGPGSKLEVKAGGILVDSATTVGSVRPSFIDRQNGYELIKMYTKSGSSWSYIANPTNSLILGAGATENAILINTLGNVGIGTTSPLARLDLKGAGTTTGFSFRTQDSAGTDRFVIQDNGNVGVGTTSPDSRLHVVGGELIVGDALDAARAIVLRGANTDNARVRIDTLSDNGQLRIFGSDSVTRVNLLGNGGNNYFLGNVGIGTTAPGYKLQVGMAGDGSEARANAWNTLSDERLKENVNLFTDPLGIINELQGVKFTWKGTSEESMGFIAQDLEKVLPQVVSTGADGYKSVNYAVMNALLAEGIKELNVKVDNLPAITLSETPATPFYLQWINSAVRFVTEVVFEKPISFLNQVRFAQIPLFTSKDVAGRAVIKPGSSEVRVQFSSPLNGTPIVTVSPLEFSPPHRLSDISSEGFTIRLQEAAKGDVSFNWSVVQVEEITTVESDAGEQPPASAPEESVAPSPTVSPSPTPSPAVLPTPTPTPLPEPVIATESAQSL